MLDQVWRRGGDRDDLLPILSGFRTGCIALMEGPLEEVHNAQMTIPLTFFDDLAFVSIDLVRRHDAWPRLVQQTAIGQILDAIAGNAGQQLTPVVFYVPRIEEGYPPQSSELMLTGRFLIGPGVRAPIWYKPVSLCKRCPVKA